MIVVIADDFTGAAELGGIGLRYKLDVEINTEINTASNAGLLVIDADTRSVKEKQAVERITDITAQVKQLQPQLVYKKTDSVMRGYIAAEINAQLDILQLRRALLVPANPALGRTISNGRYGVHGVPVHQTSFAEDPEFPAESDDVKEMLGVSKRTVHVKKSTDTLPADGIIIGEVNNTDEVKAWTAHVDNNTLAAGGSGFFSALMEHLGLAGTTGIATPPIREVVFPRLFVCGSMFDKSIEKVKRIKEGGGPVSYMPDNIFTCTSYIDDEYDNWIKEITGLLDNYGNAVIAFDPESEIDMDTTAAALREKMALIVSLVFREMNVKELYIEGGSTTAAVLRKLRLQTFFPAAEIGPGLIKMRVKENPALAVIVKPGSYDWPLEEWILE